MVKIAMYVGCIMNTDASCEMYLIINTFMMTFTKNKQYFYKQAIYWQAILELCNNNLFSV